jgi:hypothetical protein
MKKNILIGVLILALLLSLVYGIYWKLMAVADKQFRIAQESHKVAMKQMLAAEERAKRCEELRLRCEEDSRVTK